MEDDRRNNWLKNLVLRLFDSEEQENDNRPISQGKVNSADWGRVEAADHPRMRAPKPVVPSEKLLNLKTALEFEASAQTRLNRIESSQDLLLYIYEVVLFKFAALHEIGLLSGKSARVVDHLHEKLETLLVKPESVSSEKKQLEMEDLRKQNDLLKKEISELHSKYLKTGIISERETELEKECLYLRRRVTEVNSFLQIAKKKISSLSAVHEMNQSLRAKNSLLTTKVEHQRRLLQSLTANQGQEQELVSTIEKLNEENKRLKEQFSKQARLVDELEVQLPDDGQSKEVIRALMDENARLRDEMEEGEETLQGFGGGHPDESLLESLERLQDENARIRNMLESKQSLVNAMESGNKSGEDSLRIVELMKRENGRLKQMVMDKKEEIKVLTSGSSTQILVKAIARLRSEKKDLSRQLQHRHDLCQQLESEKKELHSQMRNNSGMNKKIRQIMGELEFSKKLVASLKKVEFDYKLLKNEHSRTKSQLDISVHENKEMSKKLARVTAEYEVLVKEYENLFEKL